MKRMAILFALVLILAGAGGAGWWFFLREAPAEDGAAAAESAAASLNSDRTYELEPFVVPILREGRVIQHLTLVLRIEFASPEALKGIQEMKPRLRDALLKELHGVLAFKHVNEKEEILPIVRERLLKAGKAVFGPDQVSAVLIQGMSRRVPGEG